MTADRSYREDGTNRRQLLKTGATALAAGLTASSAGCLAAMPPLGQRVQYGRVDTPPLGDPTYLEWLPAPSAFADEHVGDGYNVLYTTPVNMGESVAGRSFTFPESLMMGFLDYFGIDYDEYDRLVRAGPVVALEAPLDPGSVERTLTGSGYGPAGSYEGYDLYSRSDTPRTAAVGDGVVVFARGDSARGDLEAVVDARGERVDRYHEVDDDFERFVDVVGASPMSWIYGDSFAGGSDVAEVTYAATSYTFDADAYYFVVHRLYAPDAEVSEVDIRRELSEKGRPVRSSSVDLALSGRLATIEMRMSPDRFVRETADDPDDWPRVTWGVDHDADAEALTIRHEAGDPIDADRLSVELINRESNPLRQFADEHDRVTPGDSLVLDLGSVPEGMEEPRVQVRYRWGEHSSTTVLSYQP